MPAGVVCSQNFQIAELVRAILLLAPVAMVTVIIAPCNVATECTSALKQTLLPTQRNNLQMSDHCQNVEKG